MGTDVLLAEIKDANLRYLLLTQQMIRAEHGRIYIITNHLPTCAIYCSLSK